MGDDGRQAPQDTCEDLHEEEVFAEEMAPAQPESLRLDRRDLRSILEAIRVTDPRLNEFLESVKRKEESTSRKRKAAPPPSFRKQEAAWPPAFRSFQYETEGPSSFPSYDSRFKTHHGYQPYFERNRMRRQEYSPPHR
ncbi:unnamed protein product [Cylicocyclus nassatus]|uniref:Uncharacterized protein n=1 Tax=Cylicocyclus nassatus TaxID=53992 RepID=A0AA36HB00_CYLNA|nr:unnamed protein product [Cylicocyclus nassatus]